jgi:acyl-CoA dehydrogenase
MTEQRALLSDTVGRLFEQELTPQRRAEAEKGWCAELWQSLQALGLSQLLVAEGAGGFCGSVQDACEVARIVGRYAVPAPILEDVLARGLATGADAAMSGGLAVTAIHSNLKIRLAVASGTVSAVPWGRAADHLFTHALGESGEPLWVVLPAKSATTVRAHNLAGEPSDDLIFSDVRPNLVMQGSVGTALQDRLIVLRVSQMAGALQAVLELTTAHANQRVQFGKPIGKFQAVQQQLAVMAEEVAAVSTAAQALAQAAAHAADADFEVVAAKVRANRAVDIVVPAAHQIFGAIGFAAEHGLHRLTQRLLGWRSESGCDNDWAERLGAMVIARGAGSLWRDLTSRSDSLLEAVQ